MLLRKKLLILFSISNLVLVIFGFAFFLVILNMQKVNQSYLKHKEAIVTLYQRRDYIKTLLLTENYNEFIIKEKKFSTFNFPKEHLQKNILTSFIEISRLESQIIQLYKEKLKLDLVFDKNYNDEKEKRHRIQNVVNERENYLETKIVGNLVYRSKEALFQYRDKKYFEEWKKTIHELIKISSGELKSYSREYLEAMEEIIETSMQHNKVVEEIDKKIDIYSKMLNAIDSSLVTLEYQSDEVNEKLNKSYRDKLFQMMLLIVLSVLFLVFLIYKDFVRPLELLKENSDKLSESNYEQKIDIICNNEIGDLVGHFNSMAEHIESRKKAEEILREQALTDDLTKVYNRRAAFIFLTKELYIAQKEGYILSICYIDIDNFKLINDEFGHERGDFCLKKLTALLKDNLREEDYIFRMGGDEFIVTFLKKSKKEVEDFFESRVLNQLKSAVDLELSYGIFEFSGDELISLDDMISRADQDMYRRKKKKKKENQVLFTKLEPVN